MRGPSGPLSCTYMRMHARRVRACACMRVCAYVHVCVHARTCVCACAHVCVLCVRACVCIRLCTYLCACVMYLRVCVRIRVCVRVRVRACKCEGTEDALSLGVLPPQERSSLQAVCPLEGRLGRLSQTVPIHA
jgi:hypothetical protein